MTKFLAWLHDFAWLHHLFALHDYVWRRISRGEACPHTDWDTYLDYRGWQEVQRLLRH